MGARWRLARVRCPAHTARPGLGVLPNPPEACLGPMAPTVLPRMTPRLRTVSRAGGRDNQKPELLLCCLLPRRRGTVMAAWGGADGTVGARDGAYELHGRIYRVSRPPLPAPPERSREALNPPEREAGTCRKTRTAAECAAPARPRTSPCALASTSVPATPPPPSSVMDSCCRSASAKRNSSAPACISPAWCPTRTTSSSMPARNTNCSR